MATTSALAYPHGHQARMRFLLDVHTFYSHVVVDTKEARLSGFNDSLQAFQSVNVLKAKLSRKVIENAINFLLYMQLR